MLHNISHKEPCEVVIPLLNMAQTDVKLLKSTVLGWFNRVNNLDYVQELSWKKTTTNKDVNTNPQESQSEKLLPVFLEKSNFQIHANDDSKPAIRLQVADIPQIVKTS